MSNILNTIKLVEAKRSPEPDYDDPSWDEKVQNIGQKAKQAELLKSKGKEPRTRWNPETKKYYVDFSDQVDEAEEPSALATTGSPLKFIKQSAGKLKPKYKMELINLLKLSLKPKQAAVAETLGTPYPGTYEQTNDMFKSHGAKRTGTLTTESWSQKYKSSINCSHPKGFSQKAHCAGKKKHNESIEMEMVCEDCGMCQTHGDHSHENLDEACWKGYHKEGNKKMFGKTYPNCVKNEGVAENNTAAGINKMFNNLGDPVFSNLQRVALLAMQGRQQEAYGRLQSVIKDASPQVQKKIIDAVNNIKPVTINGKIADSSTIDKSKQHQDWIINTFIPWVQSLLGKQSVAEGSEEDSYSNKFVQSQIDYYKKHLLSGNTGDQHRIRGSLMNYERIKNQRIKNNTWQEQGVAEGLNEDVGGNYLYHATGAAGLKGMLSSGSIRSATGPQTATSAQTTLPTVSITRDWNYASGGAGASNTSVGHDAILVLDRNAVENNFKTLGTSQSQDVRGQAYTKKQQVSRYNMMSKFKTDDPERQKEIDTAYRAPKAGGEFEEAVVVPKGSLPLKGTMVGFWVNPKSQLIKDPEVMNDPRRLELAPGGTGRFVKAQQTQGVAEEQHSCPHCGGEMVSEDQINEKKDACYYKVKSRYSVWPSAYASGALVKCRKKGASNWGNGGKKNESSILEGIESIDESLHDWFSKEKWVRMDTKGNIKGPCAREPGEGKPKCLPQSKAHNLGKKGRASAAARKRREDPNPDRHGKAINVNTKKETKG